MKESKRITGVGAGAEPPRQTWLSSPPKKTAVTRAVMFNVVPFQQLHELAVVVEALLFVLFCALVPGGHCRDRPSSSSSSLPLPLGLLVVEVTVVVIAVDVVLLWSEEGALSESMGTQMTEGSVVTRSSARTAASTAASI